MTIQGAMNELINMLKAEDIPIYYKGVIEKVIETIDDYIDGKDDYVKRKIEQIEDEPQTSKIIEAYAKGFKDGAEAVKAMPQTPDDNCKLCRFWFGYCHLEECDFTPIIDKAEVVRCRDCQHSRDNGDYQDGYYCDNPRHNKMYLVHSGDYCSYGRRKQNETNK